MYNRYIPQPDGSYKKNRVSEPKRNEQSRRQMPQPPRESPPPPPPPRQEYQNHNQQRHHPRRESDSISGFFKNLLPKDLDTGDLMIILLLLLMAGDCDEDKNTALLTLALYFFM